MQNNVVAKEVKHIAVGVAAGCVLMCAVYGVIGKFSMAAVYGALLGGSFAVGSFWYLGRSVQKSLTLGDRGKAYLQRTYSLRVLLHCACVILAVKLPFVDMVAGVVPLFMPRLTIFAMQLLGMYQPRQEEEKNDC